MFKEVMKKVFQMDICGDNTQRYHHTSISRNFDLREKMETKMT